jgi:NADPH:quinone reductase-like Zn-dependent oxidoreductase
MRAVIVDAPGEKPTVANVPIPEPGEHEILVRVIAAGVNPVDWKSIERSDRPFPAVLGQDFSGIVVSSESDRFEVDQRVFGIARNHGSYAEFTVVPDNDDKQPVAPMPDDLSHIEAAALPTAGITALASLDFLELRSGQTLLIMGLTGGVGSIAAQIAQRRGAHVIGTANSRNQEFVENILGNVHMIPYDQEDPVEAAHALAPKGLDAVLDLVDDPAQAARISGAIKGGGAIVSTIGALDEAGLAQRGIKAANLRMDRTKESSPQGLRDLASLVETGLLRVFVSKRSALDSAAQLLETSRSGSATGKTVLMIGHTEREQHS